MRRGTLPSAQNSCWLAPPCPMAWRSSPSTRRQPVTVKTPVKADLKDSTVVLADGVWVENSALPGHGRPYGHGSLTTTEIEALSGAWGQAWKAADVSVPPAARARLQQVSIR